LVGTIAHKGKALLAVESANLLCRGLGLNVVTVKVWVGITVLKDRVQLVEERERSGKLLKN